MSAYDTFVGVPADQSLQGATWDAGGLTWLTPTYLAGDGNNNAKITGSTIITANFLPPTGTATLRLFFKPASTSPVIPGLTMNSDGSVGSQYGLNGILLRDAGAATMELLNASGTEKVSVSYGGFLSSANEYCIELTAVTTTQYTAKLYNSANQVKGGQIATTLTLNLSSARPATAKMSQIWYGNGTNMALTKVETVDAAAPVDTTPPNLTVPAASATSPTTYSGSVATDEGGGTLYYLIQPTGNAAPDPTAMVASGSTQAVTATGTRTVGGSGLTQATAYKLYFMQKDAAGNASTVVSSTSFTTPALDQQAPTWVSGTPAITPGTVTSSSLAAAGPTATDNVGVAGYEKSKDGGATWQDNGTGTAFSFTGLTSSTTYTLAWRAYDAQGNRSSMVTVQMTTAAPASGSFKTSTGLENNASTLYAAGTAVVATWYQGGRIGAAPTSVTHTSGTVAADGTVTLTGLPLGAGYGMFAVQGTNAATDKPYYEAGTVA
jgi:hypothetical protein